ncbi:MAG: PilZ domain-containing protein [Desulfovibrionaceae bacterium]|nr:PilZ domain-containing protein [Desulfovibrionaceae bacterium]
MFKKKEKPPKKQKAKPGATGQAGPMQAPAGPNIELKVKKNKPAPKKAFAPQAVAKDLDVKVVKKKVAAKPAPVDQEIGEAGDGFSVSLKTVDKQHSKRKAFRIKVPGMKAYCAALGGLRPVLDISALGVGLDYRGVRIPGGTPLKLNITVGSQPIATEVRVKVMRHEKGLLGCQFVDLTRSQEDGISKTILLAQKRQASFRKK